jgi:hypothetical protein
MALDAHEIQSVCVPWQQTVVFSFDEHTLVKGKAKEVVDARAQALAIAIAIQMELRTKVELDGKNSSINKLKIQNQWRKIMRLAKEDREPPEGWRDLVAESRERRRPKGCDHGDA